MKMMTPRGRRVRRAVEPLGAREAGIHRIGYVGRLRIEFSGLGAAAERAPHKTK